MSVFTKNDILKYIESGDLVFAPELDSFQLQAHSVDLRLGYTFLIPRSWHMTKNGREPLNVDFYSDDKPERFEVVELEKGQYFDLLPGEHILVSSLETITVPNDLMAIMYPRSSTNRKGISVDLTGIIDSGYSGQLVIPITNNTSSQTIRLYPGERFCQVTFQKLNDEIEPRKSRYHKRDIIDGVDIDSLDKERSSEIELIKTGDITKLKKEHPID